MNVELMVPEMCVGRFAARDNVSRSLDERCGADNRDGMGRLIRDGRHWRLPLRSDVVAI